MCEDKYNNKYGPYMILDKTYTTLGDRIFGGDQEYSWSKNNNWVKKPDSSKQKCSWSDIEFYRMWKVNLIMEKSFYVQAMTK